MEMQIENEILRKFFFNNRYFYQLSKVTENTPEVEISQEQTV